MTTHRPGERGVVVVTVLILATALVVMTTAFIVLLGQSRRAHALVADHERGLALAEAGVEKAIWELSRAKTTYRGETNTPFGPGFFTVTARRGEGRPETWTIEAVGRLEEEFTARTRRVSSVPKVTVRVRIDRWPDGRARSVRCLDFRLDAQKAPPRQPATRPASRPTRAT